MHKAGSEYSEPGAHAFRVLGTDLRQIIGCACRKEEVGIYGNGKRKRLQVQTFSFPLLEPDALDGEAGIGLGEGGEDDLEFFGVCEGEVVFFCGIKP